MNSTDIDTVTRQFAAAGYLADAELVTAVVLMRQLQRPLLVEGEAGVGKTEIARTLAIVEDCQLIRLQCYEGLDISAAVYEWNYSRQLLAIKLQESAGPDQALDIFGPDFLMRRPLLESISQQQAPVLLIDEIDRADEAFEAYLLELLSEFQVSIPELGTIQATTKPRVILTSNGTRELSDALRRRCLYHYLDYPQRDREIAIIEKRLPGVSARLACQVTDLVQALRKQNLIKAPGIAETLDWCTALCDLGLQELTNNVESLLATRGCVLKTREDISVMDRQQLGALVAALA